MCAKVALSLREREASPSDRCGNSAYSGGFASLSRSERATVEVIHQFMVDEALAYSHIRGEAVHESENVAVGLPKYVPKSPGHAFAQAWRPMPHIFLHILGGKDDTDCNITR